MNLHAFKENILLIVPFEQIKNKKLLFGNEYGMLKIVPSEEFIATKKTVDSTKKDSGRLVIVDVLEKG